MKDGTSVLRAAASICAAAILCALPTAASASLRSSTAAQDNVTYHQKTLRLGWYRAETELTAANVGSSAFHLIGTLPTHGKSFSQPLYLSNQMTAGGATHNLLIVTDTTDIVYAYDADSLVLVWRRSFTSAKVRQQLSSDTGCDDNWPNDGIDGTPVADRTRNVLYVVVPTYSNGQFALTLHAISLANGADAVKPVPIKATAPLVSGGTASVSPKFNFDRAGLLESHNTVYVPLSTHCDFDSNSAHGWLIAYDADTLAQRSVLVNTTTKNDGMAYGGVRFLGSIWQGGFGIAADAENNVYFAGGVMLLPD